MIYKRLRQLYSKTKYIHLLPWRTLIYRTKLKPGYKNTPNKTLILVGKSGIGKTQFCKAVVKHKNLKTLLVSHKEDFRRLNSTYDAIIIDDANLHEFEETQLLSIIESKDTKSIRVLYDNVTKKPNSVQMIANQHERI